MKIKTMAALSLSIISINAFAYIASPGVTVDHVKQYCSDPSQCGFISRDDIAQKGIERPNIKKNIEERPSYIKNASSILTHAYCDTLNGHVGQYVKITSSHVVEIQNESKNIERFVVKYDLYTGDDEIYEEKNVNLNPGDYFRESYDAFENIIREAAGNYLIVATTSVNGDGTSLDLYNGYLCITP